MKENKKQNKRKIKRNEIMTIKVSDLVLIVNEAVNLGKAIQLDEEVIGNMVSKTFNEESLMDFVDFMMSLGGKHE